MKENYVIPLRKEFQKAPRYKKTSKAMRALKEFLIKHTKTDKIKIGKYLNQELWKNGPKNPPPRVKVRITKEEDIITAELIDAPEEKPKIEEKKKTIKKPKIEEIKEEPKKETKSEKSETPKKEVEKVPTAKELAEKKETKN